MEAGAQGIAVIGRIYQKIGTEIANAAIPLGSIVKRGGQLHHVISKKIGRAVADHPTLGGKYAARDSRFVARAADGAAHRGYQQWHRELDNEVVDWLANNPRATGEQFEGFLRNRYAQSDLKTRFPNGF